MNDGHGRAIDYLRLSITDRCNERCTYCMPQGYRGWQHKGELLRLEEIAAIVRVAAGMGFRKFRITGGEPLVRRDVVDVVGTAVAIAGAEGVGLSSNGLKLAPVAKALSDAGLESVNVSLDALDSEIYRRTTGCDIGPVLAGVEAALAAGLGVKLNCVLMRGVNEGQLWPLAQFAAVRGLPLRLIELMPLTRREVLDPARFLSITDARQILGRHGTLSPEPDAAPGWGPAKYYRLEGCGAQIGLIGALTDSHFCERCNKVRVTAEGRIRPCLGDHGEVSLVDALRPEISMAALRECFRTALREKPMRHQFLDTFQPIRPMTAIGG